MGGGNEKKYLLGEENIGGEAFLAAEEAFTYILSRPYTPLRITKEKHGTTQIGNQANSFFGTQEEK